MTTLISYCVLDLIYFYISKKLKKNIYKIIHYIYKNYIINMPKNKFGGNKHKKCANKRDLGNSRRDLRRPEEDQRLAKVGKAYGSGCFQLTLYADSSEKKGKVCGTLYKRVWMKEGDTVLCSIRSCNSGEGHGEMVDIIHKYRDDEIRDLDSEGFLKKSKEDLEDNENTNIIFEGEHEEDNNDDDIDDFLKDI